MRLPPKYINLALLVLGFGVGQGSLFLANTYLYWTGHYLLVADFGSANALVTLVAFVGDWGGASYLAAKAAAPGAADESAEVAYASLSAFRLLLAAVYGLALAFVWRGDGGFLTAYLVASAPSLIANAVNPVGLLDGRGRSGLAGLLQALPWISVAVAAPFCADLDVRSSGWLLGALTSAATGLTVAAQLVIARIRIVPAASGLTLRQISRVALAAAPYMSTALPGHLLYRGQIYLANAYLPAAAVALFIYARQIVGVGYQATGFYLRVDWRDFAAWLRRAHPTAMQVLYRSGAVRLGVVAMSGLIVLAAVIGPYRPELARVLAVYALAVVTVTSSATLQRVYLLSNRAGDSVIILATTNALGLVSGWGACGLKTIYVLILAEISAGLMQILLLGGFPYPLRPTPRAGAFPKP